MAEILVLNGHPGRSSFCAALAARYAEAARTAGRSVREIAIADLPLGASAPDGRAPTPDWVSEARAALTDCRHWTIVAPMWWGGLPSALEAFFVEALGEGFAYRWRDGGPMWDGLLAGRSARVIVTMDTPPWFLRWVWGQPLVKRLKRQVLGFCGFSPVRFTLFGPVRSSTPDRRAAWLAAAADLGRRGV
ncbi:MAG: NAD(P)H-dependent oxidoreductase [Hyphomicrobiales bacterium]|nr:NAD(P)H-dependent oxidoreductase [Hyphomicrobiales bacterium]